MFNTYSLTFFSVFSAGFPTESDLEATPRGASGGLPPSERIHPGG